MTDVSIRDLRNRGGDVVDRAARGEEITITRAGKPVATLAAVARDPLSAEALTARWRTVPALDLAELRAELDAAVDPSL